MEEVAQKSKLNFRTKFFYGFGSISFGIKNNGFSYFVLFVYSSVLGLPAWMAGLALNIVLVVDAFTDPLVGYYSDRTRSKWGRRHPYMYAAALPVAITYYFLWTPPGDLTDWQLFSYLLVCAIIIRVFITFYEVPSISLGPELTDNYVDRTSLMSFRYFFGWFGGLTTYNLVWFWFGPQNVTETYSDGRYNPAAWSEYGLVAAVLIFIGILVTSLGTHKHIPELIEPPERKHSGLKEVFLEVKETLSANRSYMFLFFSGLLAALAGGIEAALSVYFDMHFWGLNTSEMLTRGLCLYLAPIIAIFAAPLLTDRLGKKKTVMYVWAFQILFAALPFTLRYLDLTQGTSLFPTNDSEYLLITLCIHVVINVSCAIIVFATLASMLMDLVEEIQLKTGRREEGVLFSARSFADKAVSGFGLTFSGVILSLISFPSGTVIREELGGQVPSEVLASLALWYIPICIVAYGSALILVSGYTLTRGKQEENSANPDTKVWKS
jgi:GPH family glycoside/pentoside/hexuronide:cation symporter|tara:strand:+ start:181 stop:1662 length:1482 start_codon:yes stop_codon:yes gene_type:complete